MREKNKTYKFEENLRCNHLKEIKLNKFKFLLFKKTKNLSTIRY